MVSYSYSACSSGPGSLLQGNNVLHAVPLHLLWLALSEILSYIDSKNSYDVLLMMPLMPGLVFTGL